MFKSDVISHFKTQVAVARLLDLSKGAISQWGEIIPESNAYRLQTLTRGSLKVDPKIYRRERRRRAKLLGKSH